jgi:predicted double-glycine peptidase
LESFVKSGSPVIVLIQIFKPDTDPRPYKDFNDRGHYVVIMGMDEERYYIEDPKFYNAIMYINKSEFPDRWHDYLSTEKRMADRVGIVVSFKDGHRPTGEEKLQYLID